MENNNKTNEQLHEEFEQALQNLNEKLYALLHWGSYELHYVNRDFNTKKVTWADMRIGDHRLILRGNSDIPGMDGSEVTFKFPNNPVNEELLNSWDKQSIQKDIDYHMECLKKLVERQQVLSA